MRYSFVLAATACMRAVMARREASGETVVAMQPSADIGKGDDSSTVFVNSRDKAQDATVFVQEAKVEPTVKVESKTSSAKSKKESAKKAKADDQNETRPKTGLSRHVVTRVDEDGIEYNQDGERLYSFKDFTPEGQYRQFRIDFNKIDADKSGSVTAAELGVYLAKEMKVSEEEAAKHASDVMGKADKNGDGKLDFKEYVNRILDIQAEHTVPHVEYSHGGDL